MIQRKYITLGVIFLILISIASGVVVFLRNNRNVTFTIDYPDGSAVISETQDASKKFATIKNNTSLWLQKKTYYIFYESSDLSRDPQVITVNDATDTIRLDPSYSRQKLNSMLADEQNAITTAIKKSVASKLAFAADKGSLYHRGEWYATTIPFYQLSSNDPEVGNPDAVNIYYVVLKKTDGDWKLIGKPSLILTKPDNPDIPSYIIDALNPVTLHL